MKPPTRRPVSSGDAHARAEEVFQKKAPVALEPVKSDTQKRPPGAKEQVTLRIDVDILDFFQQEGPGWQDRMNAALRKAAGLG